MQQEHNKNLEHRLSYHAGVIQTYRHQENPRLGQADTDAKCDKRIDTKTLEKKLRTCHKGFQRPALHIRAEYVSQSGAL